MLVGRLSKLWWHLFECFPHIHPRRLGRICWRHTSNRPFTSDQVSLYVTYSCMNISRNLLSHDTPNKSHFNMELISFSHFTVVESIIFPISHHHHFAAPRRALQRWQPWAPSGWRRRRHPTPLSWTPAKNCAKETMLLRDCCKKGRMEDVIEHYAIVCFSFCWNSHTPWITIRCHLLEPSGNTLVLLHQRGQTVLCKEQSKWLPTLSWRHLQRNGACHRKYILGVMLPLQNPTSCVPWTVTWIPLISTHAAVAKAIPTSTIWQIVSIHAFNHVEM